MKKTLALTVIAVLLGTTAMSETMSLSDVQNDVSSDANAQVVSVKDGVSSRSQLLSLF